MTLALASRSKRAPLHNLLLAVTALCATACVVVPPAQPSEQKIDPGTADGASLPERKILPPSMGAEDSKSKNAKSQMDKLISSLPQDARGDDSEVSIPVNILEGVPSDAVLDEQQKRRREMQNRRTDNEMVSAGKSMDDRNAKELGELDRDLDVAPVEKPGAPPSYVWALQKIKGLYRQREFENALVETNEALRHFPRSAQLLTMKGTLYQRLNQVELALASYERAYDIEPSRKLLAQMEHLRTILSDRANIARTRNTIVPPGDTGKPDNTEKGAP